MTQDLFSGYWAFIAFYTYPVRLRYENGLVRYYQTARDAFHLADHLDWIMIIRPSPPGDPPPTTWYEIPWEGLLDSAQN